jgi:hypothetical protein
MGQGMMERYGKLLLDIWREACRHIEINESATTIAKMLAEHLPLSALLIRRFDPQHSTIDTVALGQPVEQYLRATVKTLCTPMKFKRVLSWAETGEILHGQRLKRAGDLAVVVPEEIEGEVLAGPLQNHEGPAGVLLLVAGHQRVFLSLPSYWSLSQWRSKTIAECTSSTRCVKRRKRTGAHSCRASAEMK